MSDGLKEFINDIPFEQFLGHAKQHDIVIWGKGAIGEKTLDVLQKKGYKISGVIDKDTTMGVWHDLAVQTPDYLKAKKGTVYCIIAIKEFQQDIEDYLNEMGYAEIEDYLFLFHKPTLIKSQQPYVDIYGNEWECDMGGVVRVPVTAYNCKIHIDSEVRFGCDFFVSNSTIIIKEKVSFGKGLICCYKDGKIEIGTGSQFGDDFMIECYSSSSVTVGTQVVFESDARLICYDDSSIGVGDKSYFKMHSTLVSLKNSVLKMGRACSTNRFFNCVTCFHGVIEIGEGFMASYYVSIYNNDGHPIFDIATAEQINKHRAIKISDHVWAGIKVTILSGADVGTACIIGANAVVNKRFPNNCTLGGIPSRIFRKNVTWEVSMDSQADKQYWNFTEELLTDRGHLNI